ncbi:MAG: DUF4180 domain-containing protein [Bacteroidales bacterium]|nr:MAG: DUF4180 domain-containing protein [Bacteroidales bacterium]
MKIETYDVNGIIVSEIVSDKIVIYETQDALDIMANCTYAGSNSIVMLKENFTPDFFDLKTGIAGDILQKFSTYNVKLFIIGDFTNIASKSLRDFIFESNKYKRINFVPTKEDAIKKLCS